MFLWPFQKSSSTFICIFFIRLATLVEINITHFIQKIHLSFYKVQFKAYMYYLLKLTAVSVLIYISYTVALKNL